MDLDHYQQAAVKLAIYPEYYKLMYPTMGLVNEAGEFAGKVKKWMRGDVEERITPEMSKEMAKELGDVLWYLAACAEDLGYDLSTIAEMNLDKLGDRASRGVLKGDGDNR